MITCENDILIIPDEYKRMSLSELEREKKEILKDLLSSERPKKKVKENKKGISFKF